MRILKTLGVLLLLSSFTFAAGPTISAIAVASVTSNSATITWTTSPAASTQVLYGTGGNTNLSSPFSGALVTSHSVTISGLGQATTYTYAVQSVDSGGSTTSATSKFTLCNPGKPNPGLTTVTAGVNAGYATGTITAVWENDSGVSTSTPTMCGSTFSTTQTSTIGLPGNMSMQLPDNNYIVPAPSHWNFTLSNATGLNANQIVIGQTIDLTTLFALQAAPSGGAGAVSSVFGRTGAVVATNGDYGVAQVTGAAPLASPTFTGVPLVPTAAPLTSNTQAASTAYTDAAVAAAGGGSGDVKTVVTVTSAQLLNMANVLPTLIAAPGAGNVILVRMAFFELVFGTTAYVGPSDLVSLNYSPSLQTGLSLSSGQFNALIQSTANASLLDFNTSGFSATPLTPAQIDNQPILLHSALSPTTGDGTLKVTIWYQVIPFS
jgi:hypothetical protein